MAFDKKVITVYAGSSVTIYFDNRDAVSHNFALYVNPSIASPAIFQGQAVTGPGTITYKFTAPLAPGDYFFRCDLHPTIMTGTFTVVGTIS
jgi:plastocyanin